MINFKKNLSVLEKLLEICTSLFKSEELDWITLIQLFEKIKSISQEQDIIRTDKKVE